MIGIVCNQHYRRHTFRQQLVHHIDGANALLDRLAASHGHRIVIQDFVGNIGFGGHRGANSQNARVGVSTVTHVLEHVRGVYKVTDTGPAGTFVAHGQKLHGITIHHHGY